jgi:hypothetical protein
MNEITIKAVELLRPQPGDTLVLTVDRHISEAQRRLLAKNFSEACPGTKIAVIPDHWRVQVVRSEDVPSPPALDMGVQVVGPGFEAHDAPIERRSL